MMSSYFESQYHKQDEAFVQKLLQKADQVYTAMVNKLGFANQRGQRKIKLLVCDSIAMFAEECGITESEFQEWMAGCYNAANDTIILLSPRLSAVHTAESIEQIFVHEMIHLIVDRGTGMTDAPLWCSEGIALLYAEQVSPAYLQEENCPDIESLLDVDSFDGNGGYDYSAAYVWYFIKCFGYQTFLKLYKKEIEAKDWITADFEQQAVRNMKEYFQS